MDTYQQEIVQIQEILNENPKGMTVSDIARKMKINRNSVAKYLDIMRISGQVEMLTFGPAKVYFPSKRVPVSNLINYASDYILVLDSNLHINLVNDTFLAVLKTNRKKIINQHYDQKIQKIFHEKFELAKFLGDALEGKSFTKELILNINKDELFCKVKIIPTTFENGKNGVALIMKDDTNYVNAENALKNSQDNINGILNKMNKK